MKNIFDEDYFENGVVAGKSCYINYHWMPELTIKMAHRMVKHLNLKEGNLVLDFGCAKGFLVKALRILDVDAYGCDISKYAIEKADPEIKDYCKLIRGKRIIPFKHEFDWIISKDVLEHIEEPDVDLFLEKARIATNQMFHVVPLADSRGNFIIPEYELDKSHILKRDLRWWMEKFENKGWKVKSFNYRVKGIKDNWTSKYKRGNAFFILFKR